MNEVIELKFSQHPDLVKLLLGTGDAELVEVSSWPEPPARIITHTVMQVSTDSFWGTGLDKKGRNEHGRALIRLRTKLVQISKRYRSRASSTSS